MLSANLLTEPEKNCIRGVLELVYKNPASKRLFFLEFEGFCENNGLDRITPVQKTRLLSGFRNTKYHHLAALYDFLTTEYRSSLLRRERDQSQPDKNSPQLAFIENLRSLRQKPNTFSVTPRSFSSSGSSIEVPFKNLSDLYLGYRISSAKGEIVRFGFSLDVNPYTRHVFYRNIYQRDAQRITSEGEGAVIGRTLYLSGNAWQTDRPELGKGVRFFALELWRDTRLITGVVISRDARGPIASRILLIPLGLHYFGDKKDTLNPNRNQDGYEGFIGVAENFPDPNSEDSFRVLTSLIHTDREYCEDGSKGYERLKDKIIIQTDSAIDSNSKDDAKFNLWLFISNLTNTTLQAYASGYESLLSTHLGETDSKLGLQLITEFLCAVAECGQDPKDHMIGMLEKYMAHLDTRAIT